MDISLPLDFKEFLWLLNDKGVKYLLIGGYAVAYYGYPRTTNDIDVWIAVDPGNAERVVDALREFGFDTPDLSTQLFMQTNRIIRMGMPPMRIEIATNISGVDFAECYEERLMGIIDGVEVQIISLHHLKVNKRASGQHKDLNDLEKPSVMGSYWLNLALPRRFRLGICLHIGHHFANQLPDAYKRFFRIGGQPAEAGKFGAQSDVFSIFLGPGHRIRITVIFQNHDVTPVVQSPSIPD